MVTRAWHCTRVVCCTDVSFSARGVIRFGKEIPKEGVGQREEVEDDDVMCLLFKCHTESSHIHPFRVTTVLWTLINSPRPAPPPNSRRLD